MCNFILFLSGCHRDIFIIHFVHSELWHGPRTGTGPRCNDAFGCDSVYNIETQLYEWFASHVIPTYFNPGPGKLFYNNAITDRHITKAFESALGGTSEGEDFDQHGEYDTHPSMVSDNYSAAISDVRPHMHSFRVVKSPAEIEMMRKAGNISSQAFTQVRVKSALITFGSRSLLSML